MRIKLNREEITLVEGAPYLVRTGDLMFVAKGIYMAPGNAAALRPGWYVHTKDQFFKPAELRELYRIVGVT